MTRFAFDVQSSPVVMLMWVVIVYVIWLRRIIDAVMVVVSLVVVVWLVVIRVVVICVLRIVSPAAVILAVIVGSRFCCMNQRVQLQETLRQRFSELALFSCLVLL